MISAYYWPCFHLSPISLEAPGCKALFSFFVSMCALSIYCGHGSSNSPDRLLAVCHGHHHQYMDFRAVCVQFCHSFKRACMFLQAGGCEEMIWEVHYLRKNTNHDRGVPYASSQNNPSGTHAASCASLCNLPEAFWLFRSDPHCEWIECDIIEDPGSILNAQIPGISSLVRSIALSPGA